MELRIVDPEALLQHGNLRLDADFALSQTGIVNPVLSHELFLVDEPSIKVKYTEPEQAYYYCEIGRIDDMGRISPVLIDPNQADFDTDEEPDKKKQIDRLRIKVQKGDIMPVTDWRVLIPKTRTYLGKFAIVTGQEKWYFTKALHPFVPGERLLKYCNNDSSLATCLLFLALKGKLHFLLSSLSRWGKAYPTLNIEDLKTSIVDQKMVDQILTPAMLKSATNLLEIICDYQKLNQRLSTLLSGEK